VPSILQPEQCCQITTHQSGKNIPKDHKIYQKGENIPNDHKIYQP
jgi:hypothetical protein